MYHGEGRPHQKVLILGLDGATFDLILPWARQGTLPTLSRLLKEGTWGCLSSTIRPESSVAWTTFMTGKNPGKHGIFGFLRHRPGHYSSGFNDASKIGAATLWQLLSRAGRKVVALNVPMTYPPRPVEGALVSGLLAPGPESQFAFPPGLQAELSAAVGGYVISAGNYQGDRADFSARLSRCVDTRKKAALYLMERYDWDCFAVVFTGPDRIQHFLWADMDSEHPLHDPKTAWPTVIEDHYRQLDQALEEILEAAGSGVSVVVLSDHGFTGYSRVVYPNGWLKKMGLISCRSLSHGIGDVSRAGWAVLRSSRRLRALRHSIPALRRAKVQPRFRSPDLTDIVDWSKTRAFFTGEGGIRVNLRGREPEGIVEPGREYEALIEQIAIGLQPALDGRTGLRVIGHIHYAPDIYNGPFVSLAPDLILEAAYSSQNPSSHNYGIGLRFEAIHQRRVGSSFPLTGRHTHEGIFIAHGPGIQPDIKIEGAHLMDLAPTILHLLGLPVPADMDGQVLLEILTKEYAERHPVRLDTTRQVSVGSSLEPLGEDQDWEKVRERLRGLGYVG
jgi:predicted AlkP superfamily phosphohydrolase/phosphomutase